MQRRSFLIQAGSVMAGLCAGSAMVQPAVAAEPTPSPTSSKPPLKKRAILLGVSQNSAAALTADVLNDLLLQQQLLQLRYGFSEAEILQITDEQATIAQVTDAIEQHLVGADVGVFHVSGLLNETAELRLNDGVLSLKTLAEQLKSLKIRHLTTVLDLQTNAPIPAEILAAFPGLLVQPIGTAQTSLTQAWTQALWTAEKITVNSSNSSDPWKLTGDRKNESAYFITALQPLGAGAVQGSTDLQTQVWLGGLAPDALALVGPGSVLQVQHDRRLELLQVTERHDRSAIAIATGSVAMGDPIVESLRRIPRKLGLKLILGNTLSKIETVDAISAFSEVKSIELLKAEAQNADYIFTQINPTEPNRYALINAQTNAPIAGTLGESTETIKVAVRRLLPKLRSLQARKQLLTTLHEETTSVKSLAVKATLNRVNEKNNALQPIQNLSKTAAIQSGDRLRYDIQNLSPSTLYWLLWQWDSRLERTTIVLPPLTSNLGFINGGAHQPVMSGIARPDWTVRSTGKTESFLICSSTPFTRTYGQLAPLQADDRFVHTVTDPLAIVETLLTDLEGAIEPMNETYTLDLAQFITLPFRYEVVS